MSRNHQVSTTSKPEAQVEKQALDRSGHPTNEDLVSRLAPLNAPTADINQMPREIEAERDNFVQKSHRLGEPRNSTEDKALDVAARLEDEEMIRKFSSLER